MKEASLLWSITGIPIAPGKVFEKFANTVFPDAEIKRVDGGLFGSITLDPPDPLEAALGELIDRGALRFSSGSTSQLAKRDYDGRILRWPIAELSVRPKPAEFRLPQNQTPVKSYSLHPQQQGNFRAASDRPPI